MNMKTFVYYRKNEEDKDADVAVVKTKSINDAARILSKYYNRVNKEKDIYEIDFEKDVNKDKEIIIISDY